MCCDSSFVLTSYRRFLVCSCAFVQLCSCAVVNSWRLHWSLHWSCRCRWLVHSAERENSQSAHIAPKPKFRTLERLARLRAADLRVAKQSPDLLLAAARPLFGPQPHKKGPKKGPKRAAHSSTAPAKGDVFSCCCCCCCLGSRTNNKKASSANWRQKCSSHFCALDFVCALWLGPKTFPTKFGAHFLALAVAFLCAFEGRKKHTSHSRKGRAQTILFALQF